jgi:hypothetical protein
MKRLAVILAAALICSIICANAAITYEQPGQIDQLTNQIINDQLELAKLNDRLKMAAAGPKQWRGRRWFCYSLANTALTTTGALISGCGRFSYLHSNRLRRAPKSLFENATWVRVAANIDIVAGSAVELVADLWKDYDWHKAGIDLKTTRKFASQLTSHIEDELSQRQKLVDALPAGPVHEHEQLRQKALCELGEISRCQFDSTVGDLSAGRVTRKMQLGLACAANALSGVMS